MPAYHPQRIEPKWQAEWERNKTFRAVDCDPDRPKLYILDMFPYPSGAGLHVGHPEGYTATDILCRYKRMRGYNVLHPMGWDAFGLPAEQYAVEKNIHPRITTEQNINNFRRQIKSLGFSYDWDREIDTTDPGYYKWTQWIFLQIYDTWYDPDHRVDRRHGPPATGQGPADRRVADPAGYDRPGRLSRLPAAGVSRRGAGQLVPGAGDGAGQRRGHRRQERARRTSGRPHAADPVDAADHRLRRAAGRGPRRSRLAPADQGHAAQLGRPQRRRRGRFPDRGRMVERRRSASSPRAPTRSSARPTWCSRPSTRSSTGSRRTPSVARSKPTAQAAAARAISTAPTWRRPRPASSPAVTRSTRSTARRSPSGSPTMCSWATAPARSWPCPVTTSATSSSPRRSTCRSSASWRRASTRPMHPLSQAEAEPGVSVNSRNDSIALDGLPTAEAKAAITGLAGGARARQEDHQLQAARLAVLAPALLGRAVPGRARRAGSRPSPLPVADLPVRLPELDDFKPTGKPEPPLSKAIEWVRYSDKARRETNTMPQWAGSCWYYLRYIDPRNDQRSLGPREGTLLDAGRPLRRRRRARRAPPALQPLLAQGPVRPRAVSTAEPFQKLVNQGMILGEVEYTGFQDESGRWVSSTMVEPDEQDDVIIKGPGDRRPARPSSCAEDQVTKKGEGFVLAEDPDDPRRRPGPQDVQEPGQRHQPRQDRRRVRRR